MAADMSLDTIRRELMEELLARNTLLKKVKRVIEQQEELLIKERPEWAPVMTRMSFGTVVHNLADHLITQIMKNEVQAKKLSEHVSGLQAIVKDLPLFGENHDMHTTAVATMSSTSPNNAPHVTSLQPQAGDTGFFPPLQKRIGQTPSPQQSFPSSSMHGLIDVTEIAFGCEDRIHGTTDTSEEKSSSLSDVWADDQARDNQCKPHRKRQVLETESLNTAVDTYDHPPNTMRGSDVPDFEGEDFAQIVLSEIKASIEAGTDERARIRARLNRIVNS